MELPPPDALVVFALIGVTFVLFVFEVLPNDVTAVGVIFPLGVLALSLGPERTDALRGFSNTARITIVAMYMLSAGAQKTGLVQTFGVCTADSTNDDERRALAATVGALLQLLLSVVTTSARLLFRVSEIITVENYKY